MPFKFSSSHYNAAHVIGGMFFLVSSVAWIVELRAEQRLKCSVGEIYYSEFVMNLVGSEVGRKERTRTLGERLTNYGRGLAMSRWNQMTRSK